MSIRHRVDDAVFLFGHHRFDGALMSVLVAIEAVARLRYHKIGKTAPDWQKSRRPASPLAYSARWDTNGDPTPMGGGCAFQFFLRDEFPKCGQPSLNVKVGKDSFVAPKLVEPPFPVIDDLSVEERAKAIHDYEVALEDACAKFERENDEYSRMIAPQMWRIEEVFWVLCRCKLCHIGELAEEIEFFEGPPDCLTIGVSSGILKLSVSWIWLLIHLVKSSSEYASLVARCSRTTSDSGLLLAH